MNSATASAIIKLETCDLIKFAHYSKKIPIGLFKEVSSRSVFLLYRAQKVIILIPIETKLQLVLYRTFNSDILKRVYSEDELNQYRYFAIKEACPKTSILTFSAGGQATNSYLL